MTFTSKTLLLGRGNTILGDDGAGICVAREGLSREVERIVPILSGRILNDLALKKSSPDDP